MKSCLNNKKKDIFHAYASKYYDPVKAHEYYMRTRELKGRRTTSGMSDEQKKTWSYVKDQVKQEQKTKSDDISEQQKRDIETVRENAKQVRTRITDKIKTFVDNISSVSKSKKEQIKREKERKIKNLPKIPKSASPAQKERLRGIISSKKDQINEEAKQRNFVLSTKSQKDKTIIREEGRSEREAVAAELKSTISNIRETVKHIKEQLKNATEDTLDKEYANIMKNIAGKAKKGKKGKGKISDALRAKLKR